VEGLLLDLAFLDTLQRLGDLLRRRWRHLRVAKESASLVHCSHNVECSSADDEGLGGTAAGSSSSSSSPSSSSPSSCATIGT